MVDGLVEQNSPCEGASGEELARTACLKEKVLLGGDFYEIKSWLWDLDPAQEHDSWSVIWDRERSARSCVPSSTSRLSVRGCSI